MQLTFTKSEFGVPDGKYTAKFLGITAMPYDPANPRKGDDGKDMGPAIAWEFEILEGEYRGRKTGRVTGTVPTAGNACGVIAAAILDVPFKDGQRADVNQMAGQTYRIAVEPKRSGNGTQVSKNGLYRLVNNAPTNQPSLIAPDGVPVPPAPPKPPAPPPPAPKTPAPDSRWDYYDDEDKEWKLGVAASLFQQEMIDKKWNAHAIYCKPHGSADEQTNLAFNYGFVGGSKVPF